MLIACTGLSIWEVWERQPRAGISRDPVAGILRISASTALLNVLLKVSYGRFNICTAADVCGAQLSLLPRTKLIFEMSTLPQHHPSSTALEKPNHFATFYCFLKKNKPLFKNILRHSSVTDWICSQFLVQTLKNIQVHFPRDPFWPFQREVAPSTEVDAFWTFDLKWRPPVSTTHRVTFDHTPQSGALQNWHPRRL